MLCYVNLPPSASYGTLFGCYSQCIVSPCHRAVGHCARYLL